MQMVSFPGTDEMVSVIGLGTWVFGGENWSGADDEACILAVREALSCGINLIDTAPFYSDGLSERLIGRAIKGAREKVFIATKCGLIRGGKRVAIDLSPASIERELDLSRDRLQCDVIDLYQPHWPDENIPVEKTMETLFRLQAQKKIRHIGVSNFDLELLKRAVKVAPLRTLQIQYSLLEREIEKDLLPFCIEQNIGVVAYGPMGGGILTGKYTEPPVFPKADARAMFYKFYAPKYFSQALEVVERMRSVGRPLNQIALNWVRQQKGVITALAGCRTPEQVRANAAAASWDLSAEELKRLS